MPDPLQQMIALFAGIGVVLVIASAVGFVLKTSVARGAPHGGIDNLNARIRAWWVMVLVSCAALLLGRTGVTVLFAFVSFVALREFVSVTCGRSHLPPILDNGCLVVLGIQYSLVYAGSYVTFAVFVPVCVFVVLPIAIAASRDARSLGSCGTHLKWGLVTCVYAISHVPALLTLDIPGYAGRNVLLIVFLLLVVQSSDVLQYIWGKLCGRRKVAPAVSPSKTWEGLIGGVASATTLGAALYWITPFAPWQAALVALVVTSTGFLGGLTMSAIKRGCGVKDWGQFIDGHGGMLDRVDSVVFAAPAFYYLTRFGWA